MIANIRLFGYMSIADRGEFALGSLPAGLNGAASGGAHCGEMSAISNTVNGRRGSRAAEPGWGREA